LANRRSCSRHCNHVAVWTVVGPDGHVVEVIDRSRACGLEKLSL
jgi:hypothetical protein